jgi:hypothetical protein
MHEEMRSAKMIDDALRVFKTEEYSRFQNFDDALEELTRKLSEGVNMEVYQEKGPRKVTKNGA